MVKSLLFSILFISCLILINASTIPGHLNSEFLEQSKDVAGVSHNSAGYGSGSGVNTNFTYNTEPNKLYEKCEKGCKEQPHPLCKYNCEQKYCRRAKMTEYNECMSKCAGLGDAQSLLTNECRSNCNKLNQKICD